MELSDGQRLALGQLQRVAITDDAAIRIIDVEDKDRAEDSLSIDISLDCRHYAQAEGGVPLHAKESVRLRIPADFPFATPSVWTAHTRFLGFPHVQWGTYLCLYQSTATQWIPSRGMFGFLEQLDDWFRKAALNELDDPEGPLHPPIAYGVSPTTICVNENTPGRDQWPWFGAALLEERAEDFLEVQAWKSISELEDGEFYAPTVLLNFELPFEYPRTIRNLLRYMNNRGVETSRILAYLMLAASRAPVGKPMHVCIGTPSRGRAGAKDERLQHLQFWEIEAGDVITLQAVSAACNVSMHFKGNETPAHIQALIDSVFASLVKWQVKSRVRWCQMLENRPEILIRRDEGTAMEWFRGKRVAIWGCGALGGAIAEHLTRAGVSKLVLYDNDIVTPGVLVRQNFLNKDINSPKSHALKQRLQAVSRDVEVVSVAENLITQTLKGTAWDHEVDVIVDATASLQVRAKLETQLKSRDASVPIGSMMISGAAEHGAAVVVPARHGCGPYDLYRRLGLAAMNRGWLKPWVNAFWADGAAERIRQPEPGCSDPTFVASHADVAGLAARLLNAIASALADSSGKGTGFLCARENFDKKDHRFTFDRDTRVKTDKFDFRISSRAWRDVQGWIRNGARVRSPEDETGGLLFGEIDETLGLAWITSVSGPPSDSTFAAEGFVCGTDGVRALCDEYGKRSRQSVSYVGTWHSHPVSQAQPSETDHLGIATMFGATPDDGSHQLMLIVGNASLEKQQIGAYAFEKRSLVQHENETIGLTMAMHGGIVEAPRLAHLGKSIGLALSGGGSRAVAFHLGTLRALDDLNLLNEVDVISGVSGGSVMTGLYAYSHEPFADVDARTETFLKSGLLAPALIKLMHPLRLVNMLSSLLLSALPTLLVGLTAGLAGKLITLLPHSKAIRENLANLDWPLRRWYSRTHVMADAMADVVGAGCCDGETRGDMSVVFNACELRTGTAFRMSNERFGSWRYGWAPAADLRVADAITASAAYPPFLPPFDWKREFTKAGNTTSHRTIVTDGGVFENLGVSVLEPGRNPSVSAIGYSPEIIIASDAGAGQFSGISRPASWGARMTQVVNAVMRKVQDATKQRLHTHAEHGAIDRFLYVHLGQLDDRVPLKPANWISREAVLAYPTDFSAMSPEDIQRLASRGETITRALVAQYLLSD